MLANLVYSYMFVTVFVVSLFCIRVSLYSCKFEMLYVCICVCLCVYLYTCRNVCRLNICILVYFYNCVFEYLMMCMFVYLDMCIVGLCMCIHVYLYMCMIDTLHRCISVYLHSGIRVHVYICIFVMCRPVNSYINVFVCLYVCTCLCVYSLFMCSSVSYMCKVVYVYKWYSE